MSKVLGAIGILVLIFMMQYWSLVYGWGMEVKNWPVVIGCWVTTVVLTAISKWDE